MNMPNHRLALAAATLTMVALTGCTLGSNSAPATPITASIGTIHGQAFGGQQPISGASIYVYAAGTTGYGNASTLLSSTVPITDGNGYFTLTGDYTCTQGQEVYIYALGGNTGSGNNFNSGLMAILGQCPTTGGTLASVTPYVWINEVTTVAAAYSLAGFATDATHVADDEGVQTNTFASLAKVGMANAFANSASLVNIATGTALTTAGNSSASGQTASIVVPQAQINTIADILAACVNTPSVSITTPSAACTTLFSNAKNSSNVTPTDTATAAINIAHAPTANVTNLYGLVNGTTAFLPDDTTQPADFTISILFPQGGTGTVGLAVDGLGNAYGVYGGGATVYRITPTGTETALTTATQPRRLAIDTSNNVWVPSDSSTAGVIDMFTPTGTTPTAYTAVDTTGATVLGPICVAFDPSGYLWVLGATSKKVTLLNVTANPATAVTYVVTPSSPAEIGVSSTGVLGLTSGSTTSGGFSIATSSTTAGTTLTPTTGGGLYTPSQITPDASGDFWIGNSAATGTTTVVSEFNSSGAAVTPTGYTITPLNGGSNTELFSGDFDGLGNYYTGGNTYAAGTTTPNIPSIYVLNSTGTQTEVYYPPTSTNEFFAVDPSGNLWFGGNKTIGEMIGGAAPKITPVSAAIYSGRTVTQTWRP
jgi:hypothetical protein